MNQSPAARPRPRPPKNPAQPRNSYPSTFMKTSLLGAAAGGGADRLLLGVPVPAGSDGRVMQVERGPLGPDARYRGEVVPRRRAGRRPFQRVGEAPWVVGGDPLPGSPGLVDVVEEDEVGQ